jgi:hypothetical protein
MKYNKILQRLSKFVFSNEILAYKMALDREMSIVCTQDLGSSVEPLLGNDLKTNNEKTFTGRKQIFNKQQYVALTG